MYDPDHLLAKRLTHWQFMDERNDHTLDDLADLFLTANDPLTGPAPLSMPPAGPDGHPASAEPPEPTLGDEASLDPEAGLSHAQASLHEIARQLRDTHRPGRSQNPAPATHSLRYTGEGPTQVAEGPEPSDPETDAAVTVEAVLLGNLPGMAGPWLTQYAQRRAEAVGTVAVLHVDQDHLDLEIVEPNRRPNDPEAAPAATATLRVPPGGFAGRDLLETLQRLTEARLAPLRAVLVRLPMPDDSTGSNPATAALARLTRLPHWTLLTGADAAACSRVERFFNTLQTAPAPLPPTRLGLMMIGCDRLRSVEVAEHLRKSAENLFQPPLSLVGHHPQMVPCRTRTLGSFPQSDSLWDRLTAWLQTLEAPAPAPAAEAPPRRRAKPAFKPLVQPVRVEAQPQPDRPTPADESATGHASAPATPQARLADLFSLIDTDPRAAASIPGGLALEARCPSQPDTQLALDASGRLHLLHRHDSAEGDLPTPREAIVELVAVRDWARQHRQLLQLTERTRRFDPDADPVLHLFTDRADLSVDLAARLGDLLKLHLLRDVAVGNSHTWFCTPLSA